MAKLTSTLVVRLLDKVSGPAKAAARSLGDLGLAANRAGRGGLTGRLTGAIERNNAALERTRGRLVDAVGLFYVLKKAIGAPIMAASEFETVLEDIGQKLDMPQAKFAALGASIRKLARDTTQSASVIAKGVDTLAGMGANESDALAMMPDIGKAATAYRADVDHLAKAGYAALDNLKVPANQFGKALGAMAQAGKAGAFELKDMAQYFPTLTASYQGLGQKGVPAVADLAAALQITRKGAGDSAEAATNLSNVLQKINAPQTRKAFTKMGVDLEKELKKAAEAGLTPIEAITEITNRTLKGDLSKIGDLFSDAQVQKGLRPLIQNIELYREIRAEAIAAQGVVEEDYKRRLETSAGALQRLKVTIENISLSLGTALLPALVSISQHLAPIAESIARFAEANPVLTRTLVAATAGLIAFRVAMIGLSFVGLNMKAALLTSALGIVRVGAAARWSAGMMAVPFMAAGRGVLGYFQTLALRSRLATAAMGQSPGVLARMGDAFMVAGRGILRLLNPLKWIRGIAIAARAALMFSGVGVVIAGIAAAGTFIYNNWEGITSMLGGVADGFMKGLAPAGAALQPLVDAATSIWSSITNLLGPLAASNAEWKSWGETIGGIVASGVNAIASGLNSIVGLFQTAYDGAVKLGGAIKSLWNGPKATPGVINDMNNRYGTSVPVPAVDGKRARGGPVRAGRTYLVGEEGPELWKAPSGGRIIPNRETMGMLRNSGGLPSSGSRSGGGGGAAPQVTVHANFTVSGASDPRTVAREVSKFLSAEISMGIRSVHADIGV